MVQGGLPWGGRGGGAGSERGGAGEGGRRNKEKGGSRGGSKNMSIHGHAWTQVYQGRIELPNTRWCMG